MKPVLFSLLLTWTISTGAVPALATDLPPGVMQTLRGLDPNVQVRFDGQATLSDGTRYVPVLPQSWLSQSSLSPAERRKQPTETLVQSLPANTSRPDLIKFSNQAYLLRLIPTNTGKLTFIRMADYPVTLKEGLLPQDWVVPNNLSLPAELKVLLGSLKVDNKKPLVSQVKPKPSLSKAAIGKLVLAHKPGASIIQLPPVTGVAAKPSAAPVMDALGIDKIEAKYPSLPAMVANSINITDSSNNPMGALAEDPAHPIPRNLYVADLSDPRLLVIDPRNGKQKTSIDLGCVPSRLLPSPEGSRLYVSCLSSDQLVVVDTRANLIRTRLPVGSKPGALLLVQRPDTPTLSSNLPGNVSKKPGKAQKPASSGSKGSLLGFGKKPAADSVKGIDATAFESKFDTEAESEIPTTTWVLVSNRFSHQLSLINPEDPDTSTSIELPGPGGVMALMPDQNTVLVADAIASKVYVVNLKTMKATQTLPAIPAISAMWYVDRPQTLTKSGMIISPELNKKLGPNIPTIPTLFMASRTMNNVVAVNLSAGAVTKTFAVGEKPTAFAVYQNQLLVLSGQSDRLDLINWRSLTAEEPIELEAGSFPSDMTLGPDGKTLYISAASSNHWFTVDLINSRLDRSVPLVGRGVGIALVTPDQPRSRIPGLDNKQNLVSHPTDRPDAQGKFSEPTAAMMLNENTGKLHKNSSSDNQPFTFTELIDPTQTVPSRDVNNSIKPSKKRKGFLGLR